MSSYTNLLDNYMQNPQNPTSTLPRQTNTSGIIQLDDLRLTSDSFKPQGNQRLNDLPRTISPNHSRQYIMRTQGTQNQASNSLQRTHIIDEPLMDDLADIAASERMIQKRNEQVNQMIDHLLSGRKIEDADIRPTRQRDLTQSMRSNGQGNLRTSFTNAYGNPYLLEDQPERGTSSKHSDFFPTKKPVKNEYNIEQYLPGRAYLKADNNLADQVLGLTLTSPINSQLVERVNRRGEGLLGQTPQDWIPERLETEGRRDDVGEIGARRHIDFMENERVQREMRSEKENEKKVELQRVFEKVLHQLNVVENPGEVAELIASTVSNAAEKRSQNKAMLSSSQIEALGYARNNQDDLEGSRHVDRRTGTQTVSRGCQTWETHLSVQKLEPVQFVPESQKQYTDRKEMRSPMDSPIVDIARPGKALVQTEKSFDHLYGEKRYKKDYGRGEGSERKGSPKVSSFSDKKSYFLASNYSRDDGTKRYDDVLKSVGNRNKSTSATRNFGAGYTGSYDTKRFLTGTSGKETSFDIKYPGNDLLKDIENNFLESLQTSHRKFTSRLDQKVRSSKLDSLKNGKKEPSKYSPMKISDNTSPSHRFNWSASRSPGKFFSISERVGEEGREENSLGGSIGLRNEGGGTFRSPKRMDQSLGRSVGKRWNDVKFFEDEDLELLMKSYI